MCSVMWSSPDPRRGGFSLVEVTVALLLLMLLVGIAGRVVRVKDQVVEGLEEPLEGGPSWYLVPDSDPLARVLGIPAALSTTPAHPGGSSGGGSGPGTGGPGNGNGNPNSGPGNNNAGGNAGGNAGSNAGGNGNGNGPGGNSGQGPGNGNGGGNGNGNNGPPGGSGRYAVAVENLVRDPAAMTASVRIIREAIP